MLFLLDWNMPVMNGLGFCLRALAVKNGGKKPLVVSVQIENDAEHINEAIGRRRQKIHHESPFDA